MSSTKVAIVIGASRGIGRQISLTLAQNKYTVVVAAKSSSVHPLRTFPPDPNSTDSTIDTVVREITEAGGKAHAQKVDVRSPESIDALIKWTIATLDHIDAVIYNPGAIFWASLVDTPIQRYQLMHQVNTLGLYATVQSVLCHFYARSKGRLVVVSPPIYSRFPRGKAAYAMTKFAMTTLMIGLHHDFKRQKIATGFDGCVCSIWPAAAIVSAATEFTRPGSKGELRKPEIFADAILAILEEKQVDKINGNAWLDEDWLRELCGIDDFGKYSVTEGMEVRRIMPRRLPSLEVEEEDDEGDRMNSVQMRKERSKL
jgi:NAD(P)-dependent dehydrogenase (short-subunit alcohol dehydrogenase family)